jgi:hypothetical protein
VEILRINSNLENLNESFTNEKKIKKILRISSNLENLNVSFTNNNSHVPIDVIIFTENAFYSDQLTIDVETGIVTNCFKAFRLLRTNSTKRTHSIQETGIVTK